MSHTEILAFADWLCSNYMRLEYDAGFVVYTKQVGEEEYTIEQLFKLWKEEVL